MPTTVATHSGPFHADDVLAWALIRTFFDADAALIRTRDQALIETTDIVVDVGGLYDPATLRFDHHQQEYTGLLSSAGMVLHWLADDGRITPALAGELRGQMVDYVDDVDNGRRMPDTAVPCFALLVSAYNQGCHTLEEFDAAFLRAGEAAAGMVAGIVAGHTERLASAATVIAAMDAATAAGQNVIFMDRYHSWKDIYFANGGEDHPTEYVVHPGIDGRWRAVGIPPVRGSFAQKRAFPEAWAGLRDEELSAVTGVEGALFCHKNRFIAVFLTREGVLEAMGRFGLLVGFSR
ncbi:MAG: uncharacterized UPF0160 family protein [Myxococcota bacterium]|jgi:uncharacterized UPF0160 family protein